MNGLSRRLPLLLKKPYSAEDKCHREERFRSEMVFTPLTEDGRIDEPRIEALLDGWLAGVRPEHAAVPGEGRHR